jgi:hypothetical protein
LYNLQGFYIPDARATGRAFIFAEKSEEIGRESAWPDSLELCLGGIVGYPDMIEVGFRVEIWLWKNRHAPVQITREEP